VNIVSKIKINGFDHSMGYFHGIVYEIHEKAPGRSHTPLSLSFHLLKLTFMSSLYSLYKEEGHSKLESYVPYTSALPDLQVAPPDSA
jgi:long-subunit fatty acid transport protein